MIPASELRYLRHAFSYLQRHSWLALATFACALLGSLVTFVYPWLIGALIDHVISPGRDVSANDAGMDQRRRWLLILGAIGVFAPVLHAIAGYGRGHFNMMIGNRIVMDIRRDLFSHLQRLPMSYFTKNHSGTTVWTLMQEVHGLNGLFHGILVIALIDLVHCVVAMVCLFSISVPMTLTITVLIPAYYYTFRFFNPRLRQMSERVQRSLNRLNGRYQEAVSGMSVIKTYDMAGRVSHRLSDFDTNHYKLIVRHSHLGHMMGALGEMFMHFGSAILIIMEGILATKGANALTAGEFTRYLGYIAILYGPLARFASLNSVYQSSITSLNRVFSLFDIEPQPEEMGTSRKNSPDRGEVVFDGVSFRYPQASPLCSPPAPISTPQAPQSRLVLKDISLTVQAGETVALIGPSGCGKTTCVSLIPRLYDVTKGAVLVDGTDVRSYELFALRQTIAVVQQDSFLFGATIRDNLLFANPHATEARIRRAVRTANAEEFIEKLPRKYETILGERGVTLSGGQRQRLSIARALIRDPRILILDEATSALDADSECLVQDALSKLMRGRTCIIIAHRLSTIQSVDRIVALREGQIVEVGSHVDLLRRDGDYARLIKKQAPPISLWGIPGREGPFPAEERP